MTYKLKSLPLSGLVVESLIQCNESEDHTAKNPQINESTSSSYTGLITFFDVWREFQHPEMIAGVPDYSEDAMDKQYTELRNWQARLNGPGFYKVIDENQIFTKRSAK